MEREDFLRGIEECYKNIGRVLGDGGKNSFSSVYDCLVLEGLKEEINSKYFPAFVQAHQSGIIDTQNSTIERAMAAESVRLSE